MSLPTPRVSHSPLRRRWRLPPPRHARHGGRGQVVVERVVREATTSSVSGSVMRNGVLNFSETA
uniref:Uncharacterized protein n=1 Tax=Oryza glaberrima TaxID=4538 RepID=A0A679BDB8_ORYGL|nr:hypothetical protein [Oryza glaberrima]